MENVIVQIGAFVDGLHPLLQLLAVTVVGFVPFLESYTGAFVGAVTGMSLTVALVGAIVGNLVALAVAVWLGDATARGVRRRQQKPPSARRKKIIARVDRFGVPVASLIAPTVMAISITAYVMVAAGLDRRAVIVWQGVAVVLWGVLAALAGLGLLAAVT